jgi:hypothetical protein
VLRVVLLFVWLGVMGLTFSLPALTYDPNPAVAQYDLGAGEAQYDLGAGEAQYDPGAGETQYQEPGATPAATPAEAGCDWYWGYRWNKAGAWEWWCWDPEMGWWKGTDETGTKQYVRMNKPGVVMNSIRL